MRTRLRRSVVLLGTVLLAFGLVSVVAPGASATSVYTCSGSPGIEGAFVAAVVSIRCDEGSLSGLARGRYAF